MATETNDEPEVNIKSKSKVVTKEIPGGGVMVTSEKTPTDLLAMAIDKDLDVVKLEKLMEMQERWQARQAEKQFIVAFEHFQSILPELRKNRNVDYGEGKAKFNYHELPALEKAVRPSMHEAGLSSKWQQKEEGNKIFVRCVISHVGGHKEIGEWISGDPDTSGKNAIQAKQSTITYLKRSTFTAALGLSSADKDDDGKGGKLSDGQKRKLTDIAPAMRKIMSGEWTVESIKIHADLTEQQEKALQKAEDEYKKSKG